MKLRHVRKLFRRFFRSRSRRNQTQASLSVREEVEGTVFNEETAAVPILEERNLRHAAILENNHDDIVIAPC